MKIFVSISTRRNGRSSLKTDDTALNQARDSLFGHLVSKYLGLGLTEIDIPRTHSRTKIAHLGEQRSSPLLLLRRLQDFILGIRDEHGGWHAAIFNDHGVIMLIHPANQGAQTILRLARRHRFRHSTTPHRRPNYFLPNTPPHDLLYTYCS